MARKTETTCDICGKVTTRIVGKLYFGPILPGRGGVHSNYSHHADVGECCKDRLLRGFKFRKRTTAKQYNDSRRVNVA